MQPKPLPKNAHHPVLSLLAFLLVFSVFLSSCADTRKISYFEGVTDNSIKYKDLPPEPVIQTNDILSIQVTSLNPEASAMFNAPNQMNAAVVGTATYTNTGGYLVNSSGNIQFPVLGTIRAEGLTKAQLTQNIYQQLTEKIRSSRSATSISR
jgi:polysaccharide biosynthesis/export protein